MTRGRIRLIAIVAFLVGAGGVGNLLAQRMYFKPAAVLRKNIEEMERTQSRVEDVMEAWFSVKGELKAFGSTQLGREFDEVEHRLRTGLQEIGARHQLKGVQVSNARPRPERTPLAGARLRTRLGRSLSEARDFAVIKGTFGGNGSLEQVMLALASVQSQPWVHRIDRVSIEPRGRERTEFQLDVAFSVVFAPDLAPAEASSPEIVGASAEVIADARRVALRNVFVPPAPPPAPPPLPPVVQPPVAPPPAPPPYDRWKVTGVIERRQDGSTASVEVWLLQMDTGEQRILTPGDEVLGHVLEWGEGERAVFVFEGQRYEIAQGRTLAERTALN